MDTEKLDKILAEHKKWLQSDGGERADLRCANLCCANLRCADLRGANLRGADLRGADLDYSCWPLWCGSIGVKLDSRLSKQLVYHAICNMPEGDRADFLTDPVKYANELHQIEECGKLKW